MSAAQKPIRVALIGLSASATGTGWATMAHLPYIRASPRYEIVALLNSSVESARKAVKAYNLPESTRAYGDPEELAKDPDVDLVVVNTRVDKHASVLLPSLKAGKNVFSEWPMDKNGTVAGQMLEAAKAGGGQAFVGLQSRLSPFVAKMKSIIDSGRIGKVLSSTINAALTNGGAEESVKVDYFVDRSVGGNILTIHFGHMIDAVFFTLGEPAQLDTILATQRPEVRIVDKSTDPVTTVRTAKKDTPDQIVLSAILKTGVVLNLYMRGGPPMPSAVGSEATAGDHTKSPTAPFTWRIYGEKGEIEYTSANATFNIANEQGVLRVHDQASGKIEVVQPDKNDFFDGLPVPARNIGRLYEEFSRGGFGTDPRVVTFQEAIGRHRLIDEMVRRWDEGKQGWALEG